MPVNSMNLSGNIFLYPSPSSMSHKSSISTALYSLTHHPYQKYAFMTTLHSLHLVPLFAVFAKSLYVQGVNISVASYIYRLKSACSVIFSSFIDFGFTILESVCISLNRSLLSRFYAWLYLWSVSLYSLPEQDIKSRCRALFLAFQRHTMLRHDYSARLASLEQVSLLYKYVSKSLLCPSHLITIYTTIPPCLNLRRLFLAHDLASAFWCLSIAVSSCFVSPNQMMFERTPWIAKSPSLISLRDTETMVIGGGRPYVFCPKNILPFVVSNNSNLDSVSAFTFVDHVDDVGLLSYPPDQNFFHTNVSLLDIIPHISIKQVHKIACVHHLSVGSHVPKGELLSHFKNHDCINCNLYKTVFSVSSTTQIRDRDRKRSMRDTHSASATDKSPCVFPPPPLSPELSRTVITGFCNDTMPSKIEEAGCAVCGG
jgi:hypothetical protein